MENVHLKVLEKFDISSIPTLDVAVLGALELFCDHPLPAFNPLSFGKHPLVIGSGNALVTGRILFREIDAEFADEGVYQKEIEDRKDIDSIVIISASGGKHAFTIARKLEDSKFPLWLLTNNKDAPVRMRIPNERALVFPKNREPYTYNASTYLSMLFSQTQESPEELYRFITGTTELEILENFNEYDSFYLIIPPEFYLVQDMFLSKFDELFGSKVSGRVFTYTQTEHAKTVVPSERELFISFGKRNDSFGLPENRMTVSLPEDIGYASMVAIGYYVIGRIQAELPQYFKENIVQYTKEASQLFSQDIKPIVE